LSNFALCLISKLGELAILLLWKDDIGFVPDIVEKDKVLQEIADISMYALRMAEHFNMIAGLCRGLFSLSS
jgi:hypothetical protein